MKKALLFALLAFSISTFAQINPTTSLPWDPGANFMHKAIQKDNGMHQSSRQVFDLVEKIDSVYQWGWDTLGAKLKLESRVTDITYNGDNYLTSVTYQNRVGNSWENSLQFVYTYDGNNNQTSLLYKSWSGTTWMNTYQTLSTYDGNNNVTNEQSQYWIGVGWLNISNTNYTYDGNHNQLTAVDQSWDGAAWLNYSKTTNTYSNNNQTVSLVQSWDDVNAVWINGSQTLATYDGNHNRLTNTFQVWNGLSWDNVSLDTYTYDGNKNQLTSLNQSWDGTQWVNVSKTANTYSGNNLTNSLTQNWNGASWDNAGRVTNTYNGSLLAKSLTEIWDGGSWQYSNVEFYSYGDNNFVTGEGSRTYDGATNTITSGDSSHYFFKTVAGTHDINVINGNITVSPNPSSGQFTLTNKEAMSDIVIFNSVGETVYSAKTVSGQTTHEVNLTGYSKGVYLVLMKEGNKVSTEKILIQ